MDLRNPPSSMKEAMDTAMVTETTMVMTPKLSLSKGKIILFKFERVTSNRSRRNGLGQTPETMIQQQRSTQIRLCLVCHR